MSEITIQDEGLAAIMADPKLEAARRKLSFHEIRLLMNHARASRLSVLEALGDPQDWADKAEDLLGWTGSAFLAGEDVGGAEAELRCKGELYHFLCGLIGYLGTVEDVARAALASPTTTGKELGA